VNGIRQFVIFAISCSLLAGVGCEKKKKTGTASVNRPQVAPTLSEPLPEGLPDQGAVQIETAKAEPEPTPAKVPSKPKPRTHSRKSPSTATTTAASSTTQPLNDAPPATTSVASAKPPKSPADEVAEAAIGADVSAATMVAQRDKANRDLDSAESQLKSLDGRTLSSDEQSILSQVRAYISQSRKALAEGDYERAMNLANKAKLLTDALKKM
jgi:hypothetical protein